MKLKIGKQYRLILVVLIIIWIVQDSYHYHHKYEPIDLTSKESIIQSLKSDKELLYETKERLLKIGKKRISIYSRGVNGYRKYHSEALREVFQKYCLSDIWIDGSESTNINFSMPNNQSQGTTTYYGFYYKEDGAPKTWGAKEFKESGDGYVQEIPGSHTYYTEPIGDGWFYYETIYYRGLVL